MSAIPVTKILLYSPTELGLFLEMSCAQWLMPNAAGLWLPGKATPAIIPGHLYHCRESNGELRFIEVSPEAIRQAKGDIYNADGELVLPQGVCDRVQGEPSMPVVGIRLVHAAIDKTLDDNSAWTRKTRKDIVTLWDEMLLPQFRGNPDVAEAIYSYTFDLRQMVLDFIGGETWVMHFKKMRGADIVLEKTIDYRIFDWSRRHESGEWK